jgi:hypothetical protein
VRFATVAGTGKRDRKYVSRLERVLLIRVTLPIGKYSSHFEDIKNLSSMDPARQLDHVILQPAIGRSISPCSKIKSEKLIIDCVRLDARNCSLEFFFQKCWGVVKEDIMAVFKEFHEWKI